MQRPNAKTLVIDGWFDNNGWGRGFHHKGKYVSDVKLMLMYKKRPNVYRCIDRRAFDQALVRFCEDNGYTHVLDEESSETPIAVAHYGG